MRGASSKAGTRLTFLIRSGGRLSLFSNRAYSCASVLRAYSCGEDAGCEGAYESETGVYIYDFGQNLSGVARLQVQGAAGTDVQLRFAEVLNEDGTLYVDNLRTAKATDHYILAARERRNINLHLPFMVFVM